MSSFSYANACAKWFPLPALDGLVVVLPIYDANITEPDLDCDGIVDSIDPDIDGDGILNGNDAFPLNSTESVDTDGDGIGNNADLDDDNDGYSDAEEIAFGSDLLDANSIPVVVSNDGFIVSPLVGTSSQVSFTIALTHKPDSNVTLNYGSADETVAKATTTTMTFTPENWYTSQVVTVDILNPSSSTEIMFEPTVSNDSSYSNKTLEQVPIVSHQLLLFEPKDNIVYSEFNMSMAINMAYVGDNEANITVTLDTAPSGMTLDVNNSRLLWNPPISMEGQNSTVVITVSDSSITSSITFELRVAEPTLLATSIVNDKLVITDSNSSLNGLSIQALDGAVLTDYRLYKLSSTDTPAFTQGESVVGETLLIKGNIGKKVQVLLPLQGLVETDEILSFHTKSYFGLGNWRRVDYDYDFVGSLSAPVYVLNSEEFAGVVAFTKVVSGQQVQKSYSPVVKRKQLKMLNSGVMCSPKNILGEEALNDQICTFDAKPEFTLRIFNYSTLSSNIPIEDIANWLMEAQLKLDDLNMPYSTDMSLIFENMKYDGYTDSNPRFYLPYLTNKGIGLFGNLLFIPKRSLYINKNNNSTDIQTTIGHEYFHHSQFYKMGSIPYSKSWFTEATAVWFEDYVQNNNFYAYEYYFTSEPVILSKGLLKEDVNSTDNYANGLFFEMMEGHCSNYIDKVKDFFMNYSNDKDGFINFYNTAQTLNCDFGTPLGEGSETRLETKLLYYQYATQIRNDVLKINAEAKKTINFKGPDRAKAEKWLDLQVNDYRSFQLNFVDTEAKTIKFEAIPTELESNCLQRYIRIKSDNVLFVSIASDDERLADTPTTMLGDIKQISLSSKGIWDFTYLRDKNTHETIYPELYLTLIDPVDYKSNNVEVSIGVHRINLYDTIHQQSQCDNVPNVPQNTLVEIEGTIPEQYRDTADMERFIDRIRIVNDSDEVFDAVVASDATWSTQIKLNTSFTTSGYNHANPDKIISSRTTRYIY